MKTQFIHLCFAVSVILLGFVVASCKKEKSETIAATTTQSDEQLVNNVHWFMDAAKDVKEGKILKSGEKMLVDSAVYYISATLNYKYCYQAYNYKSREYDTVYVTIPILANEGKTLIVDALYGYNQAVQKLRSNHMQIASPQKKLLGCMVSNVGFTSNSDSIHIKIISLTGVGVVPNVDDQPAWPSFWYQQNTWQCNGNASIGAPEILRRNLIALNIPANCRVWFPTGYSIKVYDDPTAYPDPFNGPIDNFCDYKIYYARTSASAPVLTDAVKCIETQPVVTYGSEMGFYTQGINQIIGEFLTSVNKDFKDILVTDFDEPIPNTSDYRIGHRIELHYGDASWDCWETTYPCAL